jgi:NADH-quinone oxidoreductase subunit A
MDQTQGFTGLFITFILSFGIAALMFGLNELVGPKNPSAAKSEPFECGVKPFHSPLGHYSVKFYLVAMFFILFDVEVVWFFPWAVVLKQLGWAGLIEMFIFAGVLVLGLMYAWKKRALQWEK